MNDIKYVIMLSFLMIMPFFSEYAKESYKHSGYKYISRHVIMLLVLAFAEKGVLAFCCSWFNYVSEYMAIILYLIFLNLYYADKFKEFANSYIDKQIKNHRKLS